LAIVSGLITLIFCAVSNLEQCTLWSANHLSRTIKREDPSLSQRSKTESGSLKDKGTNHVPKPHQSQEAHSKEKKRDEKLEKAISLEEA